MSSRKTIALMVLAAGLATVLFAVSNRQGSTEQPALPFAPVPPSPTTRPEMVTLQVDQEPVEFPAAVLRLSVSGDHLNARLSSDDPPDAIQDNYHGNSFDLIMALNVANADQIDKAVWAYTSDGVPQRESGYGIFLDGQRRRLHPQDVVISFARDGDDVVVDMKGVFFEYESPDTGRPMGVPPRVLVQGRLRASVEKN
jgi:hypothetical protein